MIKTINSEQSDSEDNEILPEYDFTENLGLKPRPLRQAQCDAYRTALVILCF